MTYGDEHVRKTRTSERQCISTARTRKTFVCKAQDKKVHDADVGKAHCPGGHVCTPTNRVFYSMRSLRQTMVAGHQPNPDLATTTNMTGDSALSPWRRSIARAHTHSTVYVMLRMLRVSWPVR
jgi:hypothetical protein